MPCSRSEPVRVLMVCLGNICRSPLAEAAFRHAAVAAGLPAEVDSAGTAGYHLGKPADPRSITAGRDHGLAVTSVARQAGPGDFDAFDLLVAMDRHNHADLLQLAPDASARGKVRLFRDYTATPGTDVPDPYYGGPEDFAEVVTICQEAAEGLVDSLLTDVSKW